jgi:hypothetical protein
MTVEASPRRRSPQAIRILTATAVALLITAQISLGSNLVTVLFAILACVIALAPLTFVGINLFTLIPVIFYLRYEGLAVIFKTLLLQSLDSNLSMPVESYGLAILIMLAVALASVGAMRLAPKRQLLPELVELDHLRLIGALATGVGVAGSLAGIASHADAQGGATTGFGVLFAFFVSYPLLGMICEAVYNFHKTEHRTIFSLRLWIFFGINALISIVNTGRGGIADGAVTILLLLALTKKFRPSYMLVAAVGFIVFQGYVSPVLLDVRTYRSVLGPPQLLALTGETAARAAIDPSYLASLNRKESIGHRADNNIYDYYNNQSNIFNRLSWIGLLDQIYMASRERELLGVSVVPEMSAQLAPRFLFPDKKVASYLYSDWLASQYGFEAEGAGGALNFGLPMEGMVTVGVVGVFLYPLVAVFALCWAAASLSGWKACGPFAIFFFVIMDERMVEMQSDEFVNVFMRSLPVNCLIIYMLYRVALILTTRRQLLALRP